MCFSFAFNSIVYPMGVSKKSDLCQCQCQSNNDKNSKISRDNLFTAIKKKMKVLKKIKKRMGLAPRTSSSCPGPNNLPALQFHSVHGDNIRISRDGKVARRYESFCKGVSFSARSVKVNERVCVRFAEISNNWSGVIRFGFTCMDPASLEGTLPKYACPDLTNKPGFWGKALHERFCQRDNVLFYYVSTSGEVHYGINGEEKGLFITDVDTRGPLWAMIDIYGNSTACEFLDSRTYMCNNVQIQERRQSIQLPSTPVQDIYDINERIQSVSISDAPNRRSTMINSNNLLNQSVISGYQPIQLHSLVGRNINLSQDKTVATRVDNDFCQGYVFTQRPIHYGEQFIIQILKNCSQYSGSLGIGLTSCCPNNLSPADLPDDSDVLLDRPEYWVVRKDIGSNVQLLRGDEIKFSVSMAGEVVISRNDDNTLIHRMFIDQSLQLWAFFDVYGSTQGIRVLSKNNHMPPAYQQPPPLSIQKALTANVNLTHRMMSAQAQMPHNAGVSSTSMTRSGTTTSIISGTPSGDIQVQSSGTVLVVNLPPAAVVKPMSASQPALSRGRSATRNCESTTSLYGSMPAKKQQNAPFVDANGAIYGSISNYGANDPSAGADCTICYENPIDSVLYICGHMCMCYDCAMKHWRGGINGGACPLCRAPIRDVIRTYKS